MRNWKSGWRRKRVTANDVEITVAIAATLASWIGSALIVAFKGGGAAYRLNALEHRMDQMGTQMATKDQLAGVKEDIAEIKGMFRMTLRESGDGSH